MIYARGYADDPQDPGLLPANCTIHNLNLKILNDTWGRSNLCSSWNCFPLRPP